MLPLSRRLAYSRNMLKLVPKIDPPLKEKVRQRVKRMARPEGLLQCNRCGGRTIMTAINSVSIVNGRKTGGTVLAKDVCADCYLHGVHSPMLPELQHIK